MAQAIRACALPLSIAVVEDDQTMAELLAYNLRAVGYHVVVIGTGTGAVDRIAAVAPDVVILDWELPGLSGIEVLRQLRDRLRASPPRVVMLTGRSDREDRRRALGTGADLFVSKPFSVVELLDMVGRLRVELSAEPVTPLGSTEATR